MCGVDGEEELGWLSGWDWELEWEWECNCVSVKSEGEEDREVRLGFERKWDIHTRKLGLYIY